MFEEIEEESFSLREERILRFWKESQIFERSLKQREKGRAFSFYDGPPFATGLPHYGHLLAGTLKDVVPRYKTMKGYFVPRRFGWDCHGLPIENEIEKACRVSGSAQIEAFGIGRFNDECRKIVQRYTTEWKAIVERMGRWVDFSKTWKTMDLSFMESVWWAFKMIYEKGLIYEGVKVMPFSARLGTPLSNFEASENYQEVDDPSIVVALQTEQDPHLFFLAWTTTPWTLISNMALSVGKNIDYVKVSFQEKNYILAEAAVERWFKEEAVVVERFKGERLVGWKYKPLFGYFAKEDAFRVIAGDFVSTEEGTGIVHTAPAFGEDDFFAAKAANIPLVCPVDKNGCFTEEIPEYKGQFVKETDSAIIRRIKEMGQLFFRGQLRHRYPFCPRTDTPLIYRAMTTWFLQVEAIKPELLRTAKSIHWTPSHLKEGRFGNWLEGARDWAISRNRYWGTPIPIWRNEQGQIHVMGSIKELEQLTGAKIVDLHRDKIDELTFEKEGKVYRRIPEVFDCWFDAGSMPYAQSHYPFENKVEVEKSLPADFIAEGVDQTRCWFYVLHVLSVALFDKPAYKNVVANGILLAEDGKKMSKRLKNYPDPMDVVHRYGADAVRLYMLHSPAVKADDLRFSEKGVEQVLRQILIPLWNAQVFFLTYARICDWKPQKQEERPSALIDLWILAKLEELIETVEKGMDSYDLAQAVEPFVDFIDQLTNWYIRRSRRRFWEDEATQDRHEAFSTLYHVLLELCKITAPFIPFISDALYLNLKTEQMPESVHLCDYPAFHKAYRNEKLEKGMDALQLAVSLGHTLRKEQKIKVRQPLLCAHIVLGEKEQREFLQSQAHLIAEELNVKKVLFHEESSEFVSLMVKPNFKVLGKKVGKHMKEMQRIIDGLTQQQKTQLLQEKPLPLLLAGESFILTAEDIEISRKVQQDTVAVNAGAITVALETEITEELELEGIARELVNKINQMRKQQGLAVMDRINLQLGASEKVRRSLALHGEYVKHEVLADVVGFAPTSESSSWDINGEPTAISLQKINP